MYGVLTALGKSYEEIDALYAADSYWPQVVVYFFIYGIIVLLIFQTLRFWDKLAKQTETKKVKGHPIVATGSTLKRHLHYLKLDTIPSWKQFFEVFLVYGMYLITMIFVGMLAQLSGAVDVNQAQELGVVPPSDVSSIIAATIIFIVLPPLSEEILFRGYLYHKLREYAPLGATAVLTSILFGIAHLEYGNLNWIAAIDTFVFSLYLIYVSQKHGSLYSAIMLHVLKNSLALTLFVAGVQAVSVR